MVGDTTVAEDIASESVARLLAARRTRTIDDARAYVRRIVVNQVFYRRRRHATEQRLGNRFAVAPSTADRTEQIDASTTLIAALQTLTARQRTVLVLRFYEDMPEQAIAALLHMAVGTVKSTTSRALDELRRHLSEVQHDG